MKYRYMSDLHGCLPGPRDTDKEEICIAAGDISGGPKDLYQMLNELAFRFLRVIHIPGNHEYYGGNLGTFPFKLRADMEHVPNYTLLVDGTEDLVIYGVKIIGATLWSDTSSSFYDAMRMNDYHCILDEHCDLLTPEVSYNIHCQHLANIREALAGWEGKSIVITHHAPSKLSLDLKFHESSINHCYATEIALPKWPNYWVHGHVHKRSDYLLNGCNVVCNPRGYWDEGIDYDDIGNHFTI